MKKVAIVGQGYLGTAYNKMFPDAVTYDEPQIREPYTQPNTIAEEEAVMIGRRAVNECDIAIVAVPTDPKPNGELDMGIVEEVVDWLDTETILIKSALQPGTVDRLVEKTDKNIAVSVEYIGMGNYYVDPHDYPDPKDPSKHKLLVVGGKEPARTTSAELLWSKMSPDTRIHLISAKEAEIVKLKENAYGAFKVTWANCVYNAVRAAKENPINVHQAWSEDGRVDPMHTRVVEGKQGWSSHCYDKDIAAFAAWARNEGATDLAELLEKVIELNQQHLAQND